MTEEQKLRQEYRTKVGSTYNAKWEWYAEWLEKQLLTTREELSKLHQPTVISTVCTCEAHTFYEWEKDENKCSQCNKRIYKQTDL